MHKKLFISAIRNKKMMFIGLFFVLFFLYIFTSEGNTPFNYFVRLADAFLNGRYWITENPPLLSELIPAEGGKFYILYPPMPALLVLPFVAFFGTSFPQQYVAHLVGAGLSVLVAQMALLLTRSKKIALWAGILCGAGSIVWYLSEVGSVWYLGQLSAAFFLTLAIVVLLSKGKPFLIGLFLGFAYLSRVHTILSLPFFIFATKKKMALKELVLMALPIVIIGILDSLYNLVRFGVPWNNGYFLIPGTLDEPWFAKGIMHPSYIIEDIKIAFLRLPNFYSSFPYIQPSWAGLAIWITTPAFVFSLFAKWKERIVKLAWLAILLIFLVVGFHGGTGFAQFGYRFAVDFYPFLFLLTIKGVYETGLKKIHWLLLILGFVVNLWGVAWINKGWVSY